MRPFGKRQRVAAAVGESILHKGQHSVCETSLEPQLVEGIRETQRALSKQAQEADADDCRNDRPGEGLGLPFRRKVAGKAFKQEFDGHEQPATGGKHEIGSASQPVCHGSPPQVSMAVLLP